MKCMKCERRETKVQLKLWNHETIIFHYRFSLGRRGKQNYFSTLKYLFFIHVYVYLKVYKYYGCINFFLIWDLKFKKS